MKKFAAITLMLVLSALIAGCSLPGLEEDRYRKDTVIYIPADPTTEATEPAVETETTEESVPETTQKPSTSSGSTKKPSSGSGTSKKPSSTTAPTTAPTEEATTVPAETENRIYDISGYVVGSLETAMMDQVNSHRREAGLGELERNDRLCAIASARAYEASLSWSHARPDGRSYTTVFGDYGFSFGDAGENLLYTSGGEDGITLVSKWMGAESNRETLLYPGFTTVGIGRYEANGYVYIACLLAG